MLMKPSKASTARDLQRCLSIVSNGAFQSASQQQHELLRE